MEPSTSSAKGAAPIDRHLWRRLEPLLDELFDLAPAARPPRLEAIARERPDLREPLLHLLTAAQTEGLLSRTPDEIVTLLASHEALPSRVGERTEPFRLTAELGRGGMGAVYAAERVEGGFDQQVAVKVLKRGLDSEQ
jgi:eukaryotic-like serine/threonine-protein kinase